MNKKLNFLNLRSSLEPEKRKLLIYVFFALVLIGQLSIAVILNKNDEMILEKGTLYRMKIDSLEIDYSNDKAIVEFHKKVSKVPNINKHQSFGYEMKDSKGFYYNVEKDEYSKAYLVDTDLSKRKTIDFLQETTGTKNYFERPDFFIKGDKLKKIETGINGENGELGYLTIEADVYVYKGAYIINQIYVNRVPYTKFIEDNYFELLDIEESAVKE